MLPSSVVLGPGTETLAQLALFCLRISLLVGDR